MNLYDILVDIIGYQQTGTNFSQNSTIINICGVLIVIFVVWFIDAVSRLFFRQ